MGVLWSRRPRASSTRVSAARFCSSAWLSWAWAATSAAWATSRSTSQVLRQAIDGQFECIDLTIPLDNLPQGRLIFSLGSMAQVQELVPDTGAEALQKSLDLIKFFSRLICLLH